MSKTAPESGFQSAMYPYNLFVYSSYWGKWSRILRYGQYKTSVQQVEVDMLPLNEDRKINIRAHSTQRDPSDIISRYLPNDVVGKMIERFGEELTSRLIHDDFLPEIDWDLYSQHNNGGAEFDLIRRKT